MTDQQPSPRVNRRLLLALAGLSGLVLGLLLVGTVFGGEEEAVRPRRPSAPAGAPEPSGPGISASDTEPVSTPPSGRDPFAQIVTVPPVSPAGAQPPPGEQPPPGPSAPGAQEPPAEAPVEPSPVSQPAPPPAEPGPSSPGPPVVDAGYAALELKSIFRDHAGVDRADITVDGQFYSPGMGEFFSYGFQLTGIDANCVEVSAKTERAQMCLPATTR